MDYTLISIVFMTSLTLLFIRSVLIIRNLTQKDRELSDNLLSVKLEIPWNLNNFVRVKLTEKGLQVFAAHKWKSVLDTSITVEDIKRDYISQEGYTRFQMWQLANIFGDYLTGIHIPDKAVFSDMNVLLEVD